MIRTARNGDVSLAYQVRDDAGPGAPWTVLVHGLGYGRWGWEPVIEGLARSLRLVWFDNRGIGDSDVPAGPYTAAGMATDVRAIMDDVGADRAHVVGTSLGGMIAQELAIAHPDRIGRLVLVCTTPGGTDAYPIPAVTQQLIAELPDLAPETGLRRAVANALGPTTVENRPELVERILAHRLASPPNPDGWAAQAAAGTTYDGAGRLAEVAAPTLVVHGDHDVVIDPRNAALLARLLPDARVTRFPGCGHLLFWEEPDRFVATVLDFLERGT